MKSKIIFLFLVFIISSNFIYATTPPELPMIVSGEVYINDNLAGKGTEVLAKIGNIEIDKVSVGEKGDFAFALQNLNNEDEICFYVDGIYANQTVFYKSGDFQQLTLKVEKSYFFYYISGGILLIIAAGLIWKRKSILKQKK